MSVESGGAKSGVVAIHQALPHPSTASLKYSIYLPEPSPYN